MPSLAPWESHGLENLGERQLQSVHFPHGT